MGTHPHIEAARETFASARELGEKAMEQITDEQFFRTLGPETNSIAVIVRHLSGNMRSRWTDFLHSDGEKPWRLRDREFEEPSETRDQLLAHWNAGWACLFSALDELSDADLEKKIKIRGQDLLVSRAIDRQLSHYGYHVGQIVLLARHFRGSEWVSLSVPRGKSAEFNLEMFGDRSSA